MTKKDLRSKYRSLRNKLTPDEVESRSIKIANHLLSLPIWDRSLFHVFLSIESKKEVNTEPILSVLYGKDKQVAISKSNFADGTMRHFLLSDNTVIKTNRWGIPEPENGIELQSQQIEVVFIPLMAYDKRGNRVGYGKGFYDKFLNECSEGTLKIGLSFYDPEDELIDSSETDVSLDLCVSPSMVFEFSG